MFDELIDLDIFIFIIKTNYRVFTVSQANIRQTEEKKKS